MVIGFSKQITSVNRFSCYQYLPFQTLLLKQHLDDSGCNSKHSVKDIATLNVQRTIFYPCC